MILDDEKLRSVCTGSFLINDSPKSGQEGGGKRWLKKVSESIFPICWLSLAREIIVKPSWPVKHHFPSSSGTFFLFHSLPRAGEKILPHVCLSHLDICRHSPVQRPTSRASHTTPSASFCSPQNFQWHLSAQTRRRRESEKKKQKSRGSKRQTTKMTSRSHPERRQKKNLRWDVGGEAENFWDSAGKLWKTLLGGGGRCGVGCGDVKQMTFDESEMRPRESRIQSEFDLFPLSIASASSSAPHCDRQNQSKDTTRAHPPVKRFPLTRFRFSIHPYAKQKQKSCDCPIDLYLEVEITNLCSSELFPFSIFTRTPSPC